MKAFLRRIFGKFKRQKSGPQPPKKREGQAGEKPRKRTDSSFEPLEGRIAPAVLLNPSTIQFTDVDGDLVTVKFSKALFTKEGTALNTQLDAVFKFKNASHHVRTAEDGGSATEVHELATIDLTTLSNLGTKNPASGVNITITADKPDSGGNDLVNIGYIRAAASAVLGTTLGKVIVDGDLGQIDAGDPSRAVGIVSLTVQTMGAVGTTSQNPGGSLVSNITGAIGKMVVKGDYTDAVVKVVSGLPGKSPGKIGSLTIGGSIRVSEGNAANDIAQIVVDDIIGNVKIGTTTSDGIFGGAGTNTALLKSSGRIGNVTITGDIRGGAGKDSGEISGLTSIGSVTLHHLWAGTGENSGRIVSSGNIGAVKMANLHGESSFPVGNPPVGGDAGKNAGTISAAGNLSSFTTTEGMFGGKGEGSGSVRAGGAIGKVSIGTVLVGGLGKDSGRINGGSMGSVLVNQTLTGGGGAASGSVVSEGNIGNVTVKNAGGGAAALIAGIGAGSGGVFAKGNIGKVTITGALDGTTANAGVDAASIQADGSITSITIDGDLKGGATEGTAALTANVNIGKVKVTGDLNGGGGMISASIVAGGKITSATLQGDLKGGGGENSGALISGLDVSLNGDLGKATVSGKVEGGGGTGSGSVRAGGKLVSLTIGTVAGTTPVLVGGSGGSSGSVFAEGGVGSLTTKSASFAFATKEAMRPLHPAVEGQQRGAALAPRAQLSTPKNQPPKTNRKDSSFGNTSFEATYPSFCSSTATFSFEAGRRWLK